MRQQEEELLSLQNLDEQGMKEQIMKLTNDCKVFTVQYDIPAELNHAYSDCLGVHNALS